MGRKEAGTPQHHHANQYHAEGSYPNAIIAIVINIDIIAHCHNHHIYHNHDLQYMHCSPPSVENTMAELLNGSTTWQSLVLYQVSDIVIMIMIIIIMIIRR